MQKKLFSILPRGISQDLSVAQTKNTAFSMQNIRITTTEEGTNLCLVNEKGNSEVLYFNLNDTILGVCTLNKYVVVFAKRNETDYIYRLEYNDNKQFASTVLFSGNLNFSTPIQCIGIYETEDIQKVYWVDGINQPRVINIVSTNINSNSNTQFDFVRELQLNEKVKITKLNTGGSFHSGIIQYAFQYYNKYQQQSNIFYVTPIQYISNDKGISPEENSTSSFQIQLKYLDSNFEYVRIYSIIRTSIDSTPTVKRVTDLKIVNSSISFLDTGNIGNIEDPTLLLYLGVQDIIAGTINHKDNTLFLGNLHLKQTTISDQDKEYIKNNSRLQFEYKSLVYENVSSYQDYKGLLNNSANKVSTFKYGETYRIGVQFQYSTGNYSEVVYLKDITNDKKPYVEDNTIYTAQLRCILPTNINFEYARARLVMVPPSNTDRSIICQGIISPTVFNLQNRVDNLPFAQSSWIMRYSDTNSHNQPLASNNSKEAEIQCMVNPSLPYLKEVNTEAEPVTLTLKYMYTSPTNSPYKQFWWELYKGTSLYKSDSSVSNNVDVCYNTVKEQLKIYIEEQYIPTKEEWLQAVGPEWQSKVIEENQTTDQNIADEQIQKEGHNYYIDEQILTFNSPDIEDNYYRLENKDIKFRIIGFQNFTESFANYSIESSTGLKNSNRRGEIQVNLDSIKSEALWEDDSNNDIEWLFATYMWHRTGLTDSIKENDVERKGKLKRKVFANTRWSTEMHYITPWESYIEGDYLRTGITKTRVFNSNEMQNIKISKPLYSNMDDINYYGNVDSILTFNTSEEYKEGYPIMGVRVYTDNPLQSYKNSYIQVTNPNNVYSRDPISIKYKSTPHVVFALNNAKNGLQRILPALNNKFTIPVEGTVLWDKNPSLFVNIKYFQQTLNPKPTDAVKGDYLYSEEYGIERYNGDGAWTTINVTDGDIYKHVDQLYVATNVYDDLLKRHELTPIGKSTISQDSLEATSGYKACYIGELYTEVSNQYGGNTPEAILNNQWIPIGSPSRIALIGDTGDTYYQRWDCLKTYPFTTEDMNSVIDITSFMVESRINLDGRYDNNRGSGNSLTMTPSNFNLINEVYSQKDNFFNYRNTDEHLNDFTNQITWSKTKSNGEDIDTWTYITLANTLDLDGDKGEIQSINKFNNELYSFQNKGIARILFNSRAAINTSDGVPIEISNGGKVDGKIYISDNIGCQSKWAISDTQSGIVFFDNYTKDAYVLGSNGIVNLSVNGGMESWFNKSNPYEWTEGYSSIRVLYDINTNDIYFNTDLGCLAYNERLNLFTSFYSYEGTQWLFNIGNSSFQVNDGVIWEMRNGEYNKFFGVIQPFNIEFIANPDFQYDKVFETLEFRTGTKQNSIFNEPSLNNKGLQPLLSGHYPFDTLSVSNEYQSGSTNVSTLKKKFRIWRWQFPRSGRDRIRNTWAKIKIQNEGLYNEQIRLYDMQVHYYI